MPARRKPLVPDVGLIPLRSPRAPNKRFLDEDIYDTSTGRRYTTPLTSRKQKVAFASKNKIVIVEKGPLKAKGIDSHKDTEVAAEPAIPDTKPKATDVTKKPTVARTETTATIPASPQPAKVKANEDKDVPHKKPRKSGGGSSPLPSAPLSMREQPPAMPSPGPRRSRTGRFEKNIETNMKEWPEIINPTIDAGCREVFLPASAYEQNPDADTTPVPKKKEPAKAKKKKGNTAVKETNTAAANTILQNPPEEVVDLTESITTPVNPPRQGRKRKGSIDLHDNALHAVMEEGLAAQETNESADLGPPLAAAPPALTIRTDFKRKKGYYYDPVYTPSMATPSRAGKQTFNSCLLEFDERTSPLLDSASKMSRTCVLQRALSIEELNDDSWLSSSLIDLVFSRFARSYDMVDFLPVDFAVMLSLPSSSTAELFSATDILGRRLCYEKKRPMLLLYNSKNIHWILIKVQFTPAPELLLFEPMGQPINPKRGMSYRIVPRDVVRWLDTCCPLPDKESWLSKSISAITKQQQFTSFDCGVACLLYAEKCGQGQVYN